MSSRKHEHTKYALITVGSIATATLLRSVIDHYLNEPINYSTYYLAVMVSGLYCGMHWGLFSVAVSGVAATFCLPPFGKLLINELNDLSGMALFLVVSGLIVWLSHRVRQHQRNAEQAAEERRRLLVREQAAREEAERLNHAKDDFLAAVSHELRTPLQSILGWSQILSEGDVDREELQLATSSIERGVRMQSQLINDLLDMSRIVMGKLRLELRPVNLEDVVRSAVQTVLPAALARNIQIDVNRVGVGAVLGDGDRLQQVVWNLLTNAIKFTPSGGEVQIEVRQQGDQMELVVKDTGEGIAPEFLAKVFDRFEQSEGKRRREGLGLGLAIVKELMGLHGGAIEVHSQGKGHGAEFRAVFPKHRPSAIAAEGEAPASSAVRPRRNSLAGKQVLVVDDDADARQVLKAVLKQYGMDVLTAESAVEARELLASYKPDAVTCDLDMPGIDGLEFVRELRSRQRNGEPSLPVIALTACASETDRLRVMGGGFQGHLIKPVQPAELATALVGVAAGPNHPR